MLRMQAYLRFFYFQQFVWSITSAFYFPYHSLRNLFSQKFHKSCTRRNFSFIGKKQKFRRRETKVSSRWNKSFSSVELMQLLRDIIFVLWRTLLAEKVDTFERHIHKKGCLEYCLFMYSVAFFSLRNEEISSIKFSQIFQKPFRIRHTPVKRSKKYVLQHACSTDTYQSVQKKLQKKWQKSLERNEKESTFASAFDKESHS